MSDGANLSCFQCNGEFEAVGSENGDLLYECEDCGLELREDLTRELAEDGGAIGRLAEVLLERGDAE
jgi:uncharacterized Zn finger protein